MSNPHEKELELAAEELGKAISSASEKEKAILRDMKKQVDDFTEGEAQKGKFYDKSAIFAFGMIAHPELNDENLIKAAKNYIDMDYAFIKSRKK